ncbi:TonB-dependent receptor [Sphingobium chlorophenolicum L-1]|uniref:TonB-dependent receptor n=1 Tax=Sphingobium chlorophenolicum L-1 TaxID=690566 RepID=F6F1P0_SPHCR|nr:TonB-dependent receptor [Sphingobium chlorophenolicum]AEG51456.1 TonB-dependent receptor [Sphingobium chlorophenolicum L-1]
MSKSIYFSCVALSALMVPAAGLAQTATQPATEQASADNSFGDIVVTASKRAESINSVPMSITAASGDQLIRQGVTGPADLAKIVPGFSFVPTPNGTTVFSLRGVGFNDPSIGARPTVSVYVDEAPLPFTVMTVGAQLDVERVEVLKGPQGTLFGSNATGGAVNYVAAKPTDEFHAGIDASYGRFNTVDLQGYLSGPITDTLGVRVSGRIQRSDDWQKSYTRHDTNGAQNVRYGRILLDWKPTDKLTATLNVNGFKDRSETAAQQLTAIRLLAPSQVANVPWIANYPLAPENARSADWNPGVDYRRNNRMYQIVGRLDYELSDAFTLTSLTAWSDYHQRQNVDSDGTSYSTWNISNRGTASSFSQELRLSGDFGPAKFILGGNYSRDKTFEEATTDNTQATSAYTLGAFGVQGLTGVRTAQKFKNYAVFGNVDFDLTSNITLHAGARYTKSDLDYTACVRAIGSSIPAFMNYFNSSRAGLGLAPLTLADFQNECVTVDANFRPGAFTSSLNEDNVSWRFGLDYKVSADTLLYANISRGFKGGSAPTGSPLLLSALRAITQEQVTAYEAGFKASVINRALQVNGAVFYYDYLDKQLRGRIASGSPFFGPQQATVNIPESRVTGAELQVIARPVEGLNVTVGGTYLKSKVRGSFQNYTILGALAEFGGESFPFTPEWQLVSDAEYEFPVNNNLKGFVGAAATYRTKTFAGFGEDPLLKIDGYALADLRAGIAADDDSWRLTAFVQNVGNKYYWFNVDKVTDTVRRLAGMPRTYGVRLSYRY